MVDFARLNRETKEYWQNYYNNKTYKTNNGEYSSHYF